MNNWYSKYGFHKVVEQGGRVSDMFRKWCFKGYISYLGRARNVSRTYSRGVKYNITFDAYCKVKGIKLPETHGMAKCDMSACFKSFAKYDKGEPVLDELLFRRACSWTERRYAPIMGGSKIMSKEEVLTEMDKTTSCGYPWNIMFKNKNEMLANQQVAQVLDDFWMEIEKDGCDIQAIWKVAQKNELLPIQKVRDGKVRTFTAAPIELSVAANRLFMDQNHKMNDANILRNSSSTSFVGATKFASGWNKTYNHLDVFPNAYELDESSYDASVFEALFEFISGFRYRCIDKFGMTAEDRESLLGRVKHVYSSIVHSLIVLENGDLLMKETGNPSGSTNTINDNTLALDVLINYAWLRSCERLGRRTDYDDFNRHVRCVLNGDDNTYTCSHEAIEIIKPEIVAELWSEIGVITKTPCYESRPLKDVTFLSHSFYFDRVACKYFPKPERDKVLSSLLLASSTQDVRWHYLRACALRIESFWDLEVREIIFGYICYLEQNYMADLNGTVKDLKWENIRALFMSDDDIETLYEGKESGKLAAVLSNLTLCLREESIYPDPPEA